MKRTLSSLSRHEYGLLQSTGMFWEFYPEAPGDWMKDCGGVGSDRSPSSVSAAAGAPGEPAVSPA
jgi:hypothetical protein